MTIYSLDVLMSHFETSLLFQVWFYLLLLDLDLQVSQETWKVVWYSQIFKIFQFVVIHIVKDFRVIDEVNFFLEFFCFFYDPMDVSNLISGSSAFSKSRIYTWTFMVSWAVKSGLQLSLDLAAINYLLWMVWYLHTLVSHRKQGKPTQCMFHLFCKSE